MAGLLDSARDFERWLADLESSRPVSHPHRLDPEAMYQIWLQQKMEQDKLQQERLQQMAAPPPSYQAAQWPTAMREASAIMPVGTGTQAQPRAPAGFASPTLQPPLDPFANRMTGPPSRNLEDRRTPVTAEDVSNWLRNPYNADDQYWKW